MKKVLDTIVAISKKSSTFKTILQQENVTDKEDFSSLYLNFSNYLIHEITGILVECTKHRRIDRLWLILEGKGLDKE